MSKSSGLWQRRLSRGVVVAFLLLASAGLVVPARVLGQGDGSVTVSALPIEDVNRDPGSIPYADLHANISYTIRTEYTPNPALGNGSLTPFQFNAPDGSYLSFCVKLTPSGYVFARMWGVRIPDSYGFTGYFPPRNESDYIHFPHPNEDCLLNQRVIANMKIVMFFTKQSTQPATVKASSAPSETSTGSQYSIGTDFSNARVAGLTLSPRISKAVKARIVGSPSSPIATGTNLFVPSTSSLAYPT